MALPRENKPAANELIVPLRAAGGGERYGALQRKLVRATAPRRLGATSVEGRCLALLSVLQAHIGLIERGR